MRDICSKLGNTIKIHYVSNGDLGKAKFVYSISIIFFLKVWAPFYSGHPV
jgi:hypothetical protein